MNRDDILHHARRLLRSTRDAANDRKAKGRECAHELNLEILMGMLSVSPKCALTGMPIEYDTRQSRDPFAPSIDRVDSDGGYTIDNVRVTVYIANTAANNFGDEAFNKFIQHIRES